MKNVLMVILIVLLSVSVANAETLIGTGVQNGDFEIPATGKVLLPDPSILNWSFWTEQDTSAMNDTGVDASGTAGYTDGRIMFIQPNGAVKNMTTHIITTGEEFTYGIDNTLTGRADIQVSLVYDNAGVYTLIPGTTLTVVAPNTGSGTFTAVSGQAYIGKPIGLGVYATGNWPEVDNAVLEGPDTPVYVAPVSPDDGEIGVPVDADLEWTVDNGWGVNLYWGPEGDPNLSQLQYRRLHEYTEEMTWNPQANATVDTGTVYYWRVDALEPNTPNPGFIVHTGPVWSYETIGGAPRNITISPVVGQSVTPGDDAVFIAGGVNIDAWTWYKDGVPLEDVVGVDDYIIDANVLIVLNADIHDEGFYYCEGENSLAPEIPAIQTTSAQLLLKRLMGHWKLDNNLSDSVQDTSGYGTDVDAYPGTMDDPNYVAEGKNGAAIEFFREDPPRYVTVSDPNEVYNFYPLGITVSAWIKSADTGWGAIVSKADRGIAVGEEDPVQLGWAFQKNNNSVHLTFRGGPEAALSSGLSDDLWHLVVGTYDPNSGLVSVYASYIDDDQVNRLDRWDSANPNFNLTSTASDLRPLIIGAETNSDDTDVNMFRGLIDDVRIYSYPMYEEEISKTLYLPIAGGDICANPAYDQAFDLTNDCKTNLDDLAALAGVWLENGLYVEE